MSYATQMIRAGRTYDYECSRSTHRLRMTIDILESMGASVKPSFHTEDCARSAANLANVVFGYRDRICCDCGRDSRGAEISDWVTDEIINQAWALADSVITSRAAKVNSHPVFASLSQEARDTIGS